MEVGKLELAAVEKAIVGGTEGNVKELGELELVLVGGGLGDISLG